MEYGYSCMGYEIAGGLGVKMARPGREVIVIVGDGSYLMLNAEIATSVMLGRKLIVVVLDNRGYGCINRLQQAVGGEPFNNLLDDCVQGAPGAPRIDFAAHAAAMGARAENVKTIPELEAALARARASDRTYVICIETDPAHTTAEGGCWWEVAVPEVSERAEVRRARADTRTASGGRRHERAGVPRREFRPPGAAQRRQPQAQRRRSRKRSRGDRAMKGLDVRIGINPISWSNDDLPSLGGETPLEVALAEGRRSATRASSSATSFRANRRRCARCSRAHGLALVSGWYSGRLARRSVDEEIAAVGPHLKLLADNGANVMVYGEVADSIQGAPQPLYKRPRFFTRRAVGRVRATG